MDTLDQQLDQATAQVAELTEKLSAAEQEVSQLQMANTELRDNFDHAQAALAKAESSLRAKMEENETLKATAQSAEEKAAEYYAASTPPAQVSAMGEPKPAVAERFNAISDPTKQTEFLRSLSEAESAELYSNI